ncbi:LysR family transcriptional regulator [uncultured Agrobacterium sp.]|uniref:LysR family transcriptional regulator n=1 Tax=uncultured Agrobacterium sp. TaxID=157277 RepID=UPI00258470AA|nr:LysR family transcriptional regulator [uncultured Agrobacterium sp.]
MHLRALMYFDELVRTNSMRAAAENLGVAPTAISRQIENLEEHFGTQLVERSSRGVKLTAAGELLAARAGKTLRELNLVQQLMDDLKGLERGEVTIFANGAAVNLLAPVLSGFSIKYPKLRFNVQITSARQAIDALNSAEADVALMLFGPKVSEVEIRARKDIVYDVILPADHPLANAKSVTLKEIAAYPLALPEKGFAARQAFDEIFASAKVALDPVFTVSSLELLRELVLDKAAITLLPSLSVSRDIRAEQMVAVPLAGTKGVRTEIQLCTALDRDLSFAASTFISFVQEVMKTDGQK